MQKLKVYLVAILAFVGMQAYAQSVTVTGKVVDPDGYEVIGGSVTIKGAAGVGTVTDVNGNYSLQVKDASKDVLVFSYVGMKSQEMSGACMTEPVTDFRLEEDQTQAVGTFHIPKAHAHRHIESDMGM